jgi:hydroxyacylglutathione hydrolase
MPAVPLPAFDDNYIWCLTDAQGQWLVVDPGQAAPVLDFARQQGCAPLAILLTHHHGDHIGGVAELIAHWPDVPVHGPDDGRMPAASRPAAPGKALQIGAWTVQVIDVSGHTRSHLAYLAADHLFCGDALFSLGCGRMFEGTPSEMLASLDRLAALPPHTRVCCGHEYTLANAAFALAVEPHNAALQHRLKEAQAMRASHRPSLPSTIGSELECNPFLRTAQASVAAAVADRIHAHGDRVAVFAALRGWKDGFTA